MAKVLIVDDEESYRDHLSRAVTREGHDVDTAHNGRTAVEVGACFQPDVLIVDWMLKSSLNGLDVSNVLRRANPNLLTIIISGYPLAEFAALAERAGVFACLDKPFDLDELRDVVRRAAGLSRLHQG